MEQQENISELFDRYLNNACTAQEIRLLFAHFELLDDEVMLQQLVRAAVEDDRHNQPVAADRLEALTGRVEAKLTEAIRARKPSLLARLRSAPVWAVAASILVVLAIGALLYQQQWQPETTTVAGGDVMPGGNLATLTLEDGNVIELSTEQHGIVVGNGISYLDGSGVDGGQPMAADEHPDVGRMALTTPKGGTYQLTLPDGTNVWLNAASTLRYPARFTGGERVVELEGEAYFDVTHQRAATGSNGNIPFRVISQGQTVEVLGTQFNIAAYADEGAVRTTLVEGAVKVVSDGGSASAPHSPQPVTLRPGQQSVVTASGTQVNAVDVSTFTAWKDGLFSFKETEMREAMKQLARWYNVDIVYEGQIPETYFFGDIRRDKSLSHVLAVLKKSGIHFRIMKQGERNSIVVIP